MSGKGAKKMIKAGVIGILGYAGEELLKILSRHPKVQIKIVCDRGAAAGKPIRDIYPGTHLPGTLKCEDLTAAEVAESCDVVFLAIPHGESVPIVTEIIKNGKKAIDLSADFRLKDAAVYEKWYKIRHARPDLLETAVYGLPELYKNEIKNAKLLANPGCYPTTVILGLAPLLLEKSGAVDLSSIIIDSKSGVSGGGRIFAQKYFDNEHPNHKPYNIAGTHRHIPEMEQELTRLAPGSGHINITFSPHIIPAERGMLSTIYVNLKDKINIEHLYGVYTAFYKDKPFVRILSDGKLPAIRNVVGTNFCEIALSIDERAGRVIVVSSIDNLIKGASGQAVQNMNIMFDLEETEGIL